MNTQKLFSLIRNLIKLSQTNQDSKQQYEIVFKTMLSMLNTTVYADYAQIQKIIASKLKKNISKTTDSETLKELLEILEQFQLTMKKKSTSAIDPKIYFAIQQRIAVLMNMLLILIERFEDIKALKKVKVKQIQKKPQQTKNTWFNNVTNVFKKDQTNQQLQTQISKLRLQIQNKTRQFDIKKKSFDGQLAQYNEAKLKMIQDQTKLYQMSKKLTNTLEQNSKLKQTINKQQQMQNSHMKQIKQFQQSLFKRQKIIQQQRNSKQDQIAQNYTLKIQYGKIIEQVNLLLSQQNHQQQTIIQLKEKQIKLTHSNAEKQKQIKQLKKVCAVKQEMIAKQKLGLSNLRKEMLEVNKKNKQYYEQIQLNQKYIEMQERSIENTSTQAKIDRDEINQLRKQNAQLSNKMGTLEKFNQSNVNDIVYNIKSIGEKNEFIISKLEQQKLANTTTEGQLSRLRKLNEALQIQVLISHLKSKQLLVEFNKIEIIYKQFQEIAKKQLSAISKQNKRQIKTNKKVKTSLIDINQSMQTMKTVENKLQMAINEIKRKLHSQQMFLQPHTRYYEIMKSFK